MDTSVRATRWISPSLHQLGVTAQALSTQIGQWLVIAVVAFIGMGAAMRAMRFTRA